MRFPDGVINIQRSPAFIIGRNTGIILPGAAPAHVGTAAIRFHHTLVKAYRFSKGSVMEFSTYRLVDERD